ncbi:MAG: hypothetical protein E2O29_01785 [Deltaproteobacteria bacterium]|nr:MAG: hypothetical protein E2O29_01785 [Deltaproteobacteria bacterium]
MTKQIDWEAKAKQAEKMSYADLYSAINDCIACVQARIDDSYYSDEASIYRAELKKRKGVK